MIEYKLTRKILIFLFVTSGLLTMGIPLLCSHMQHYWKAMIGVIPERTGEFLEKKRFWRQLDESGIPAVFAVLTVIYLLII